MSLLASVIFCASLLGADYTESAENSILSAIAVQTSHSAVSYILDANEEKKEEPKKEEAKKEEPKQEEAKKEEPKKEEPKKEEPKQEEAKKEEPKKEEPKQEEAKKEEAKPVAPPAKPKYETVEIKAKSLSITEELSGTIIPQDVYPINLDIAEWGNPFRILKVKAHGTRVEKGDRLIELDLEAYDRALTDLRREVKMAEIVFARAQAAIEKQRKLNEQEMKELELGIERSKDNFKFFWDVEWPAKLAQLELQAQADKASLDAEEEEFNQLKKMYEADDMVEHEEEFLLKRQKLALDVARFNYQRSVERYNRSKTFTNPNTETDNKLKYTRLEVTWKEALTIAPTVIKEAELTFEAQKIALERINIKLNRLEKQRAMLECRAPESGIFLYGNFENNKYSGFDLACQALKYNGAMPPRKTLCVVVPEGDLSLSISIPEKLWSDMENGLKGWFVANAYSRKELSVSLKSFTEFPISEGEYQGTVQIREDIPAAMKLLPGMKGKVRFNMVDKAKAIMIPESALGREGASTQRFVYVMQNDAPVKRTVQTGYFRNNEVEITDGLESGENIVKDWRKVEL